MNINNMNIIFFDQTNQTYKRVDLTTSIHIKSCDRLLIPKTANEPQIEWVKKQFPSDAKYTLFERDPYLVFFFA